MSSETVPQLFHPIKVGNLSLQHRVVLAPCTRFRCDEKHVPLSHVPEYYGQRSGVPESLLITEATFIHAKAGGYPNAPGIWSDDQIAAWKKVLVPLLNKYIYHLG
jgi:NADPH2 dehydrogenase